MMLTSKEIPRPEYPRPQFVRSLWFNLNGEWEFAFDDADEGLDQGWHDGRKLPLQIIVPFGYQTALSGINDKAIHEVIWYARSFELPDEFYKRDLLLNFGAVDYACTVWVNGQEVGHNRGGHVPFQFDIAPYLKSGETVSQFVLRIVRTRNNLEASSRLPACQKVSTTIAPVEYGKPFGSSPCRRYALKSCG